MRTLLASASIDATPILGLQIAQYLPPFSAELAVFLAVITLLLFMVSAWLAAANHKS